MIISAFPKIVSVGDKAVRDIFNYPVQVSEKIDGSQFVFGKINGELQMRSKGKVIYDNPDALFTEAYNYVKSIESQIPDNTVFYCEYLKKPKHNVLAYEHIPTNHLCLFAIKVLLDDGSDAWFWDNEELDYYADILDINRVPELYYGKVADPKNLYDLLEYESYLGGCNIEGFVIKAPVPLVYINQTYPITCVKYVSEKFKEKHKQEWKGSSAKSQLELFYESLRTEARWNKAIQHLRDNGELLDAPKDIGPLIKEIHRDLLEEELECIKNQLWNHHKNALLRKVVAGFPEYYKQQLLYNINLDEQNSW